MRVLLLATALILVAAGCGGTTDQEAAPRVVPPETSEPPPDAERPQAPPIEGRTLEGEALSLADLRGRPVLVNVWSSW